MSSSKYSKLKLWTTLPTSKRYLVPFEVISFPADSEFAKYLLADDDENGCKQLPSDPRLQSHDFWQTAKKEFEDETVMERQAGWDDKIKEAFSTKPSNTQDQISASSKTPSFSEYVDQVEEAMAFIKRNIRMGARITGKPQREEVWEYPLDAVREAVINAVCH